MTTQKSTMFDRLLKQSILTLCKEAIAFDDDLVIDGIICLTCDGGPQQVIKVHELFLKVGNKSPNATMPASGASSVEIRQSTQKPNVQCVNNASLEVSNNASTSRESEGIKRVSDADANAAATADTNTNRTNAEVNAAATADTNNNRTNAEVNAAATADTNNNRTNAEVNAAATADTNNNRTNAEVNVAATADTNNNCTNTEVNASTSGTQAGETGTIGVQETDTIDHRLTDFIELQVKKEDKSPTEKLDEKHGIDRSLPSSTDTNIFCKMCSEFLADCPAFENHTLIEHGQHTCYICLKTFTNRTNMQRHIRLHTGTKPFKCPKCPETFARRDDVKRHVLRHNFEKPFRCAICQMGYSDRPCIKNHMQKEHGSDIVNICSQCGESYISYKSFQEHVKKSHPESRNFSCEQCEFVGSSELILNKHMLSHGPSKLYSCPNCSSIFPDAFLYTDHLRSHKTDICKTTYACCFCDAVLPSYDRFQRHEHIHDPSKRHTCRICQKQFSRPASLKEHMSSHIAEPTVTVATATVGSSVDTTDEAGADVRQESSTSDASDYWCTECQHGFSSEFQLQTHIMDTHEPDPFICERANGEGTTIQTTSASDFKTPTSGLGRRKGNTSKRIHEHIPLSGVLNKLKNKIKSPATERKSVYDEPTQLDAGSVYDEPTQHDDYTDNSPGMFNQGVYDEATRNDSDSPANNERHNVGNNTRNNGTGNKTPYSGPATEAGTANTSNPELRTLLTQTALNNDNCASTIGKDNANESGTPRVTGTTAAAASMGGQTRRETSTGRANTPIMKQKDWKIPDLSKISAERQKTTDINNVAYANTAAVGETAAKRAKLMAEAKIKVDQLDDASNESFETDSPTQYSKTSVLGMDTDFSSADNLSSAYTNTKVRHLPVFEKVFTPDELFKSKGSFTCNLCDAKYTDFDNFNVHCDLVHHTYFCEYCGKSFTSKPNRERHARYHTGTRPYKCDECGDSFFRGDDLKYHTASKHAAKLYTCGVCHKAFAFRKQLEKHFTAYPEHMTRMASVIGRDSEYSPDSAKQVS